MEILNRQERTALIPGHANRMRMITEESPDVLADRVLGIYTANARRNW
jgi:hypothetical protein